MSTDLHLSADELNSLAKMPGGELLAGIVAAWRACPDTGSWWGDVDWTWEDIDGSVRLGIEAERPPHDKHFMLHFITPQTREGREGGDHAEAWKFSNAICQSRNEIERAAAQVWCALVLAYMDEQDKNAHFLGGKHSDPLERLVIEQRLAAITAATKGESA